MRCPVGCPKGPYCFIDDEDPEKTHYKLYTPYLRQLVKHKLEGKRFDSHADIPDGLRKDLYAEAERANARKRTARALSPAGPVPVTINNTFPEQLTAGSSSTTALQSRYDDAVYKEAIVAAERLVQDRMLGLDHLHEPPSLAEDLQADRLSRDLALPHFTSLKGKVSSRAV
ncbi:hypothetical protein A1O3_05995 [Capronia epimyces CBS 606.96]|uniref:Uncharacterized protein n=1 Tax=Capronia epimyces CBS 606.96 TaxID=1182542 RepID=W9XNQ0_9EURO|nr:uncharacterized protein A1O3_05995 [Capronia epimyces CBS 606.96]EXJ82182.1 hypothetical protein A1O3_05995 [Capronia epimyces CBS 606.96]